jgi:glycerol-3-phosphate O-acyltransferase
MPHDVERELQRLEKENAIPAKYCKILREFYEGVEQALNDGKQPHSNFFKQFLQFLQLVREQVQHPYSFQPYHQKVRTPFDYYRFGLEFVRPLVDRTHSRVHGEEQWKCVEKQLHEGENAILLANHQTETDPQAIAILLEEHHPVLAEGMIYIAGERVVTDPLAIPFSMGCDLLCIYSKRYIDHPPELKAKKQLHNKHTMERMSRLLSDGGKVIYVAPSGGRDRRNAKGVIEVAPFDPQSIEMLYLMAQKAQKTTHFYPFVLATYELLPPPDTIQHELGESRIAKYTPIQISLLPEFDMDQFAHMEKGARRKARAEAIWRQVDQEHRRVLLHQ